jgi:drug/metabolite transporter (DMT)-like permease
MPFGLLTGLGAALSWGTLDIFTALASRRVGSLVVTAGMQLVGAVCLVAVALATGIALPTDPGTLAIAALLGLIGAGAYLSYFTGLAMGPIAVVSGMVAAYGGISVVLSVVFRGETLNLLQAAGAAVATLGVILTGIAFDGGWRATRFAGPGVAFALVATILFAGMTLTTDIALESAGWLQVLVVARMVNATLSIVTVTWLTVRPRAARSNAEPRPALDAAGRRQVAAFILLAGSLDVLGLASFAIGLETAPTWLVGLASSFGPVVTIVFAVAFLGERLKPIQWLGLAGVGFGMVAIGLP